MTSCDLSFGQLDLSSCDREPIHIPGSIQSHGVLLVVDCKDFSIKQFAGDTTFLLGIMPDRMLRLSLFNLFDPQSLHPVINLLQTPPRSNNPYVVLALASRSGPFPLDASVHITQGLGIIELEPSRGSPATARDALSHANSMSMSLQQTQDLSDLFSIASSQVRSAIGYDRVMIYQFLHDGSGKVVAEDKEPYLESYLDLHYPASDIPVQARALFKKSQLRLIPDINYIPAPLVPPLVGRYSAPLDMSRCTLRSVSPIHLEYLRNMGVAASLTISIVIRDHLWGLVVCHNYSPRYVSADTRLSCEFFAQILSSQLDAHLGIIKSKRRLAAITILDALAVKLMQADNIVVLLTEVKNQLFDLISANGVAVSLSGVTYSSGEVPPDEIIAKIVIWVKSQNKRNIATNQLGKDFPPALPFSRTASGMLALLQSSDPGICIFWFRPELSNTVTWAGDPTKPAEVGLLGDRLTPRKSFEAWQLEVRGQSAPWDEIDIETAHSFRVWLLEEVLRQVQLAYDEREKMLIHQRQLTANLEIALEIEKNLAAAQAAEMAAKQANLAKSEFLASMSHEIRTPLNIIIGFTSILRQTITGTEHTEKLDKINYAAGHLLKIVNDILDMSKIEAGKTVLDAESFSLCCLIDAISSQFSRACEIKGLDLIIDTSPDIPDKLYGDTLRLSQCLINYVNNAIKFTSEGSIIIRTRKLEQDGDSLLICFCVEDSGVGICSDAIPKLFCSFEQADKTTTREFGGTGLGLALTKKFAELMGGDAGVDSTVGKGSRFWFTALLQLADETEIVFSELVGQPLAGDLGFAGVHALIVEDVAMNRDILEHVLQGLFITVDMAENGKIAIDRACSTAYDLILMDMQMPVMDGLSATESIRKLPGYGKTPIIALTANAYKEDRDRCLMVGMSDFIAKPVRPELLRSVLSKWLRGIDGGAMPTKESDAASIAAPPTPSQDEHLRLCLAGLADIDLALAPSANEKPARFIRYLLEYTEVFGASMTRLREHMVAGEREEAVHLAYALRGASAQLGVVGIEKRAGDLEAAIRKASDSDSIQACIDDITLRLAVIFGAVRRTQP